MKLRIRLLSDTTFGRGDGIAGQLDSEVEHDANTGMPMVKGRTIKGILVESCADILYALSSHSLQERYKQSAQKMFGQPGSSIKDTGCLYIGRARLADDLRNRIRRSKYDASQVLDALTTIRYQTAVDTRTNRPQEASLRATRVVVRETIFYADVISNRDLIDDDKALLAASAAGMRRAGQSRTRGTGRIAVSLIDDSKTDYLSIFTNAITGGA